MALLFDLENVQKLYGRFEAIKSLNLKVAEGSVGLLGPNGAGKSTLIKTLLGLLTISRGSASVLGFRLPDEASKIRQVTGYMPENDCYLPYMTAIQYVSFSGQLAGMPRAESFRRSHEVLHYVGLGEARYRALGGFSTGMKQRVKLAQALVHGPKLVFLDEPTNGLDPPGRDEMLELIEDVKARGVNIVLSSHLLTDVERVCEQVIMLNHGELLYSGNIDELTQGGDHIIEIETKGDNARYAELLRAAGVQVDEEGLRLKARLDRGDQAQALLKIAVDNGIQVRHFMPAELTLEAAFLGIIDEDERGGGSSEASS